MADISRSQAFQGLDGHPTKDHMAFKTTFVGHHDAYPIELLKDSSYVFAHDTKVDTHSHDIINHDPLADAEHFADDTRDFGIDKEKIGAYRLFIDDLIDPILLNWENLTNTGAFATGHFPTAISITGNLHIANPDPVSGFNAHLGAKTNGTHPHIANNKKNTPKRRSKKARRAGKKRPGYCTECDIRREKQVQIDDWAAQGILTCTDCIRRPQRAPGKLCTRCFKGDKDEPKFVNPISDSSNTTRDDSIQSIAHATVSNLPVAPAAGSSTLAKCRECKVGTA
ncbi:hypothetical protein QR685DRAFT_569003 [Neurospora intermedia]|uniref:Uncharacterized protein n=1 Tax=Neurospora intermedia TaxID=5142 RepID=A0ABR3DM05_NEUIN